MTACAFGMEGDTRLARGLAAKAKRQEQEKAETQPRPQEERHQNSPHEEGQYSSQQQTLHIKMR